MAAPRAVGSADQGGGYRIQEAHRKIDALADANRRRDSDTELSITFSASGRRTHDLITAQGIAKSLGGRQLFRAVDVHVRRGTRLGIAGNNASGKTTLLRVLAKLLSPDEGSAKHANELRIALFDQQRQQLDPQRNPATHPRPGRRRGLLHGGGSPTSSRGAKRFGFRSDQLATPIGELSGGEQARAMTAIMMRTPADVLMLDEPTNDLDIPSVEVLEQALIDFPGAVVLISHDRHLLDRVCTEILGLHDDGDWGTYGSAEQWQQRDQERTAAAKPEVESALSPSPTAARKRGLTYLEKKEWEGIEKLILEAEAEVERLASLLEDPEVAPGPPTTP